MGMVRLSFVRCRWTTLGGRDASGRSFIPSSKRACEAVLILCVSSSNQMMFLVVFGMKPRKIPLRAFDFSLALRPPGGRTHTLAPKVLNLRRFSFLPVASSVRDFDWPLRGRALMIRRAW